MIFETHGHYDDEKFDEDREELFARFREEGVELVMNIGADMTSSRNSCKLAEKYPFVYAAVGVHPSELEGLTEADMEELLAMSRLDKVKAIGEIGLDYYYGKDNKEEQIKWFERQLELAAGVKLPVVIHSRDAAADTLNILKAHGDIEGGVIHCFSYEIEMAREYLDMGYYLGIGGVVTFKNSRKLKEVVEYAPLDRLVLETDSPYLAPVPMRGKRNSALYIPYIAEEIAAIKGVDISEVYEQTFANGKALYRIK